MQLPDIFKYYIATLSMGVRFLQYGDKKIWSAPYKENAVPYGLQEIVWQNACERIHPSLLHYRSEISGN